MQECNRCRIVGFPNQMITFEKAGEDPYTGKITWRVLDQNGQLHIHKGGLKNKTENSIFKCRKLVDINTVIDIEVAKRHIKEGWEYKTVFPSTP